MILVYKKNYIRNWQTGKKEHSPTWWQRGWTGFSTSNITKFGILFYVFVSLLRNNVEYTR